MYCVLLFLSLYEFLFYGILEICLLTTNSVNYYVFIVLDLCSYVRNYFYNANVFVMLKNHYKIFLKHFI